jgi:hypothetical protein
MISRYKICDKKGPEPVHYKGRTAIQYIRGKWMFIMQCIYGNGSNKEE